MTLIINMHGQNATAKQIATAIKAIESQQIVLIPTETGYCFVGRPDSAVVHKRFLELRAAHPKTKPFSLLCSDLAQISAFTNLDTQGYRLAKKLLPGPVTLVLGFGRSTPRYAGFEKQKTVGVRISSNPLAASLSIAAAQPLLITSVTATEELEATHYFESGEEDSAWWAWAEQICDHFHNGFDIAFSCDEAVPLHMSTIVDLSAQPPKMIRDGGWDLDGIGFI